MAKISAIEIPALLFDEQASAPTTPATGLWKIYTKSDGLYVVDDAGTETGPMGTGSGGGGGGSELLGYVEHAEGGTVSTTSASFVDVDATNLAVTFTAPTSGVVVVVLSAPMYSSTSGATSPVNLRDSGGDITGTIRTSVSASQIARTTVRIRVSGLTGSSSYTWKWGWKQNNSSTGQNMRSGVDGGFDYGPATMEVWSA